MNTDVILINPGNSFGIYQELSNKYSSVEPPTWSLLLAQSCRTVGFNVKIIDVNAEKINNEDLYTRIINLNPRLICLVVYGQNVNAGTTNMSGAVFISKYLKSVGLTTPISLIGSYVQALPKKTLNDEQSIDFGFTNEAVYALRNVLSLRDINQQTLKEVKGLVLRTENGIFMTPPEKIVPNDRMDIDLPGYAWDLLPFKFKPLDLYKSPMWHAEYNESKRSPYAAIQTSLGCQFQCDFCMINTINRDDNDEIGVSANYNTMRYWSTDFIIKEFDKLVSLGVHTIKVTDEMFLLNKKYYIPLCEMLRDRGYGKFIRMWVYSRVDTIRRPETLKLLREAGIKWLALGIESANKKVRLEVSKGKFEEVDIEKVVEQIHESGIEIMANYIFGLPGDNLESMNTTLQFSKKICTLGWNGYPSMALPGSQLYKNAVNNDQALPESYEGYSFHSYETLPLSNEFLTSSEIIKFRDDAFHDYHSYPPFLEKIKLKFGDLAVENIQKMNRVKLKRKIIDNTLG